MGDIMTMAPYRRALVTGATSGIGRSLALWLAARGVTVIAAGRRREKLEELRDEAARIGGAIEPLELDVAAVAAVRERLGELDGRDGGLDLVVANAGVGQLTSARKFDWEACESILRVNVLGAAATLTAVLPGMLARGRGHLVAVASIAAVRGFPQNAAYGSSKAFLRSFMESLRLDLAATAVKTTCVFPGFVKSEMTATNRFPMPFLLETDEAAARIGRAILAQRAEYWFPWQMALPARALALLPSALYARLGPWMSPRRKGGA
ncbi:MAG TPA: SDR family NAD(P)-dependent oxidoreductase [Thermoanaerobaculia bacterium]|nr:SDR family NAD(P)-dependent oxidoreductase [Thermoanaerobaculia bacterium]